MIWLTGTLATCVFEIRRSLTLQRLAVSAVLSLFPPTMLFVSLSVSGASGVGGAVEFFVIVLVALVTVLSLLLWATPIVYTEMEGKSWTFLASRPYGRISVYLGKYLAAVIYTTTITTVSITLCMGIATAAGALESPLRSWLALCGIFAIASFVYGAIFSLIVTIIFKRAMVLAAGYMFVWEGIISNFPSVINRLTMRFHLQSIAIEWLGYYVPESMLRKIDYAAFYGVPNTFIQLPVLAGFTVIFLVLGCVVITNRQYISSEET